MKRSLALAAALTLAATTFAVVPAHEASAQTARNLKCNGCVGKRDLGKKSVTAAAIRNRAVRSNAIVNGAVTTNKLANGAVTAAKLADGAKPAGVAGVILSEQLIALETNTVVASVVLTAPADGFALVSASGTVTFAGASSSAFCEATNEANIDEDNAIATSVNDNEFGAISQTRVFPAVKGENTYRMICTSNGPAGTAGLVQPSVTALFVPTGL